MTGEEWGTGVKESGDPCSYSKEEVEKAAAAKSGEEGKRATKEATTVVGGVDGERGHQQQQLTPPQEENTVEGEGNRFSTDQGKAQAYCKEDQDRGVNSSTPEGGTATAVVQQGAGAATQAEALTGRVEASATSSTLSGQDKPGMKSSRGAKSGGSVGDTAPGRTASLPPQVLSDAIVAAYQRGYQQGLSALSTSTSAVPPSPVPVATITSPLRGAVALSSSLPSSPFRGGAFVPSMGLGGSPLSSPETIGGIAAGTAGTAAGFFVPHPPSPHVRLGVSPRNAAAAHGVATAPSPHGVAFRVPPERRAAHGSTGTTGGEDVRQMKQHKVEPEALECSSDHRHHLTGVGVNEKQVRSKEGDDGATFDEDTYDEDDDDDDVSVTVKKRERARLRANNRKGYIDMIAQKDGKDMTEYERNELKSWEERRDRKNNRSRERSMEKKSRIRRILDTPVEDRSDADKEFLNEYQDRRHRKNEGDRLRRERIRKMAGCGPKPRGVTVTARGPIKLPTGQVVEREEDAVAVLGHDQVKPDSKKGASRPRKRKSEAAPAHVATGGAVVPNVGAPPFLAAGVGRNMQLPPTFLPPQPTILTGHHATLLPSATALYPHYGAPILPKASLYGGLAGHGRDVVPVPHSSLMAMHRMRPLGGIGSGLGGALPYPPFVGGVGGASAGGTADDFLSAGRGSIPAAGSASHRRTASEGTGSRGPTQSQPPPPAIRTTTTSKREGLGSATEGRSR